MSDARSLKRKAEEAASPSLHIAGRYALFQVPGLLLAGTVLFLLHALLKMPSRLAWVLFALWAAKDALLFPLLWRSYIPGDSCALEKMTAMEARAAGRIDPKGRVLVRGESWAASLVPGSRPVDEGEAVAIRGARGLTLLVEALPAADGEK